LAPADFTVAFIGAADTAAFTGALTAGDFVEAAFFAGAFATGDLTGGDGSDLAAGDFLGADFGDSFASAAFAETFVAVFAAGLVATAVFTGVFAAVFAADFTAGFEADFTAGFAATLDAGFAEDLSVANGLATEACAADFFFAGEAGFSLTLLAVFFVGITFSFFGVDAISYNIKWSACTCIQFLSSTISRCIKFLAYLVNLFLFSIAFPRPKNSQT
jgi:hypothetical protein